MNYLTVVMGECIPITFQSYRVLARGGEDKCPSKGLDRGGDYDEIFPSRTRLPDFANNRASKT